MTLGFEASIIKNNVLLKRKPISRKITMAPEKQDEKKPPVPQKIKDRLYPIVLNFFAQNDFHQVNIRKISHASGVSTRTMYKYFHSKEDLLLDVLEEKIGELKILTAMHGQGVKDTKDRFYKAFWVALDYYDRNPELAITFFITVPTRTWMQRESYARYDIHELLRQIIKVGRERGDLDPNVDDAQITGLYFMHMQREVTIWYYRGQQWKLVEAMQFFFPLFWKTISAPSQP